MNALVYLRTDCKCIIALDNDNEAIKRAYPLHIGNHLAYVFNGTPPYYTKWLINISDLQNHLQTTRQHAQLSGLYVFCPHCSKCFPSTLELESHMEKRHGSGSNPHICQEAGCNARFPNRFCKSLEYPTCCF